MRADQTKAVLASAFLASASASSIRKITVSQIVADSNMNRKTFYYHFEDKNDLIAWIFRRDLGALLEEHANAGELVFEDASNKASYSDATTFPYYLRNKTGIRSFDNSEFFGLLARCIDGNRAFYRKVFEQTCDQRNGLKNYLYRLYLPALMADIRIMLGTRYLKQAVIDRLASFFTEAFVSDLERMTLDHACDAIEPTMRLLGNVVHETLSHEIEELRLHRKL